MAEMRKAAKSASDLLKILANDHRLVILCLLLEKEMSVKELGEHIELDQSPLSQHLARLRAEGLVSTRKESQHVYYSIKRRHAAAIIETLYELYCKP